MFKTLYILSLLAASAVSSAAEVSLPARPAPRLGTAMIREGNLEVAEVICRPVWEPRTRDVPYTVVREVNGEKIREPRVMKQTYQVSKYVTDMRSMARQAGAFWVRRDGKLLDVTAAAELLREPTPVVFAELGDSEEELDQFYRQFFKPGTLIVGLKARPPDTIPRPPTSSPQ